MPPFNGSGTFVTYTPGNPVVTGTTIDSTAHNATIADISTGLTNAITRDGQSPASANLPMGGFKLTGLAAGSAASDSARFDQITITAAILAASGGAALIGNTPAGNIAATTVQTALNELDTEKAKTGLATASGLTMSTARVLGRTTAATGAIEELTAAQVAELIYSSLAVRSYISGMTLSTAGSSTTMSIAAGQASDSTNAALMSLAATSKTTSAWAVGSAVGGLDTGTIANSTWYYFYAIRRPDTGVVDMVFSLSATSPTLPTNYTQYRYIGGGKTNGSAQWTKFIQTGDDFYWDTPVVDFTGTGSTTATTQTLTTPRKRVKAYLNVQQTNGNFYVSDLSVADLAPQSDSITNPLASGGAAAGVLNAGGQVVVWTNTSAQIRRRELAATTCGYVTIGWMDPRGKDV